MKKVLSVICLIFILVPCMFVFSGCSLFETKPTIQVISVEKTSTQGLVDTYTITYSDGRRATFTVTNGKDGEDGKDGEGAEGVFVTGIEKTSTDELVDTYTVTYSDGKTSTFTVENGENGKSLTMEDIYLSAQENGFSGTFLEFLETYLAVDLTNSSTAVISTALLSSASVYCNFTKSDNTNYTSAGAGVIYQLDKENGNAYIITNYHVVYDKNSVASDHISDDISIYIYGYNTSIPVTYVGGSMTYDIAVLKVTNSDLLKNSDAVAVSVANSDDVSVGESAIAIGNPESDGIAVTSGVVSVDSEVIEMTSVDGLSTLRFRVIRIDTPVNPGNSGGGLFDSNGDLIGIVNAKVSDTSVENIAYAIPGNIVKNIAQKIINECNSNEIRKIKKVTLGITVSSGNSRAVYDSETSTVKIYEDATIVTVDPASIASGLGFQAGDIIKMVQINSEDTILINRNYQIGDNLLRLTVDNTMKFTVERNGESIVINYTAIEADFKEVA